MPSATKLSSHTLRTGPFVATEEGDAWRPIDGTWQPLHGSFFKRALSVEWHDFRLDQDLDWSRSFHRESLEICLNFSGTASLRTGTGDRPIAPNEIALYTTGGDRIRASRPAGVRHQFLTIELGAEFLHAQFAPAIDRLKAPVRQFMAAPASARSHRETLPLPSSLLASRVQFVQPPVPAPARDTWFLGRVLEVLSQTLFPADDPAELLCQRHKRINRERVERARYLIERDLENPPSLEMLAAQVSCSPFYLSRIFTQETGASIPRYLRLKRIEKASELLRTGKVNVTEAAMAVGYSSLSAFNKAFVEQVGCCPGLYPNVPIAGRTRANAHAG